MAEHPPLEPAGLGHTTPAPHDLKVPAHVREAFHAPEGEQVAMGTAWDYGVRVGNVVFSQVAHPTRAAWSAKIREKLSPRGVRVVRPLRSADARFMNAGWRCSGYVEGQIERRVDETIAAALRLDEALAEVAVPEGLGDKDSTNAFTLADWYALRIDAAEAADPLRWLRGAGLHLDTEVPKQRLAASLIPKIVEVLAPLDAASAPLQVTHADMFATTIYHGTLMPAVTDLVCSLRPKGYSAALTAVDALLVEAVDEGVLRRFAGMAVFEQVPFVQLALRALLYRVIVHALHEGATSNTGTNLEWVTSLLVAQAREGLSE